MSFDSWTTSARTAPIPPDDAAPSDDSIEPMSLRTCISVVTNDICDAGIPADNVDGLIDACAIPADDTDELFDACDAEVPADSAD